MSETWKIIVDRRVCASTGLCAAAAPAQFELDQSGQSHAKAEIFPASQELMDIAESCPVEAITVINTDTGEPLFPSEY